MKKNISLLLRSIGIAAMFGAAFALGACSEDAPLHEEQEEEAVVEVEEGVEEPVINPIDRSRDMELSQGQNQLVDIVIGKAFEMFKLNNDSLRAMPVGAQTVYGYKSDDSYVFSPIGLMWPMVMLANGTRGDSQSQIIDGLGFSGHSLDEINGLFRHLAYELVSLDATTRFNVANSIWISSDMQKYTRSEYLNRMGEIFEVPSAFLGSFADDKGGAKINEWAYDESEGYINPFLIASGDDSHLAIANLLHFRSNWVHPFDPAKTAEATFYNEDGTETTVAMMEMEMNNYRKLSTDEFLALRLPYGNEAFAMTVVMPRTDIDACIDAICNNKERFIELSKDYGKPDQHILRMPKFDITYRCVAARLFDALGIRDIFDSDRADLSGVYDIEKYLKDSSDRGNEYVMNVFQTCRISVDEKQTEAGAGSYVLSWSDKNLDPFIVTLDHPFLFIISERSTGLPLFMGRVTKM